MNSIRCRRASRSSAVPPEQSRLSGELSRTRITLERGPMAIRSFASRRRRRSTSPTRFACRSELASGRVVRDTPFRPSIRGYATAAAVEPVTPSRAGAAPAPRAQGLPCACRGARAPATIHGKRGDTLSKIASEVKPAEVTLDQMLVALFKSERARGDGQYESSAGEPARA